MSANSRAAARSNAPFLEDFPFFLRQPALPDSVVDQPYAAETGEEEPDCSEGETDAPAAFEPEGAPSLSDRESLTGSEGEAEGYEEPHGGKEVRIAVYPIKSLSALKNCTFP